jgi:hypothetical protein
MCQRALYCYISAKYIRWPVWHRSWDLMKSYLAAPYTIKPLILNRNQRESKRPAENLRLASLGISPRSVYLIPSWGVGEWWWHHSDYTTPSVGRSRRDGNVNAPLACFSFYSSLGGGLSHSFSFSADIWLSLRIPFRFPAGCLSMYIFIMYVFQEVPLDSCEYPASAFFF